MLIMLLVFEKLLTNSTFQQSCDQNASQQRPLSTRRDGMSSHILTIHNPHQAHLSRGTLAFVYPECLASNAVRLLPHRASTVSLPVVIYHGAALFYQLMSWRSSMNTHMQVLLVCDEGGVDIVFVVTESPHILKIPYQ